MCGFRACFDGVSVIVIVGIWHFLLVFFVLSNRSLFNIVRAAAARLYGFTNFRQPGKVVIVNSA
ncbi:MAG: hypothetical protein JWQ40_2462 [Segetibacter sp.]|nr:hypothetical protein [Segetibacter sp.]